MIKKEEKAKDTRRFLERIEVRKVELTFTEPILGMSPLDPEIYTKYIASKAPIITLAEEEVEMVTSDKPVKKEEMKITGFFRAPADGSKGPPGYLLADYQIRGFFKSAANTLKGPENLDVKNLKSKIERFLFIFPRMSYLKAEIDGILQRPLRGMTPKGERISLVASEMVNDIVLQIELHKIPHPEITWALIEQIMDYGLFEGISQWRGASYGRFTWKYIKIAP